LIELPADARSSFDRDGFVVVDRIIETDTIPRLHCAFSDLFSGKFETGVRPVIACDYHPATEVLLLTKPVAA